MVWITVCGCDEVYIEYKLRRRLLKQQIWFVIFRMVSSKVIGSLWFIALKDFCCRIAHQDVSLKMDHRQWNKIDYSELISHEYQTDQ